MTAVIPGARSSRGGAEGSPQPYLLYMQGISPFGDMTAGAPTTKNISLTCVSVEAKAAIDSKEEQTKLF